MTSEEIKTLSGMSRANIRYYEAEGFLPDPVRLREGDVTVCGSMRPPWPGLQGTGATVHFANAIPDGGEILSQRGGGPPRRHAGGPPAPGDGEGGVAAPSTDGGADFHRDRKRKEKRMRDFLQFLRETSYPGRGIVVGRDQVCYFIMGRSANSRNRVFVPTEDGIRTEAHDPAKLEDPSLILYHPVRRVGDALIVTNGDQTDTIRDHLLQGGSFQTALASRRFEPDMPNFTPRISGILHLGQADFTYELSILKSVDAEGSDCARHYFTYPAKKGLGHLIHTYEENGNPIPTFQGEPRRMAVPADIDVFTEMLWSSLNENNKISLYVRYLDPVTGEAESRMINKHQ